MIQIFFEMITHLVQNMVLLPINGMILYDVFINKYTYKIVRFAITYKY